MSVCEKCWADSGGGEKYIELLKSRDCTPEEQAGIDAEICSKCKRKTIHQHTNSCTNLDCEGEL